MVTYQYLCSNCNELTEIERPMGTAPRTTTCQNCDSEARKIICTNPTIITGKPIHPARKGRGKG
jgi:putative FmdB family regulatory protein